jgi:hypothetical protein
MTCREAAALSGPTASLWCSGLSGVRETLA